MKKVALLVIVTVSALIILSTCKKESEIKELDIKIKLPTISTLEVTEITINSAKSGGNITKDGGGEIFERGVVWSTTQNPSIELHEGMTSDATGAGVFESNITGLVSDTIYFVRAYAKNTAGVVYGNQEQFKTGVLPEAEFGATAIEGFAPLKVEFIDHSTNNPVTWHWNFGDGNTSTQQNPIHTYEESGNYTVQLSVTNIYGSDTEIKYNYVIVTTFICGSSTFTDIDGNVYNSVLLGDQCWMKENLRTTRDAAGNNITRYCYDDNPSNCLLYGGLYSWNTVMNGEGGSNSNPSGVQGICPTGWHVPSDDEWMQLLDNVISHGFSNLNIPYGAGNVIKSCRQVDSPMGGDCNTSAPPRWESHSIHYGIDRLDFSGLPAGNRRNSGEFFGIGTNCCWWSSSESSAKLAWARYLSNSHGVVLRNHNTKSYSVSVRCLRID